MSLEKVDASQVCSYAPDGVSNPVWMGQLGNISGLTYGYAWPGGAASATFSLLRRPGPLPVALGLGRVIRIFRGGGPVWEGILQAPAANSSGWTVTAHGNGTYGDNFEAVYTTWNQNDAINQAIARGLRWKNPGSGLSATGLYLAQQEDSGSQNITSFMASLVTYGAYVWGVDQYGYLSTWPLPVAPYTPDRIIVAQVPADRTITADVDSVFLNYQTAPDPATTSSSGTDTTTSTTAATTALTSVQNQPEIDAHGTLEQYVDLSSATSITTAGQAQAIGNALLSQYQRANFASPFTVQYGQLLNMGGVPVDPGSENQQHVYMVVVFDSAFGGEIYPGPLCFPGGATTWNDDTASFQITPYQSVSSDFSSLATVMVDQNTPPPSTSSS